jgi:acyl-CoA dehydrogenase
MTGVPASRHGTPGERLPTPPFTREHEDFRQAVRRFVASELLPHADEWEAAEWFPDSVFGRLAELGYIGLKFDDVHGGDGDPVADAVFVEELAWCGSGGVAAGIGAHSGIALPPIAKFGTEAQKQRYLVPGIRGERIAALAITEPGAGSDVAAITTAARPVEGGWLVNGSKQFITGGCRAQTLVTAVKTTSDGGHNGLSFLLIDSEPTGRGENGVPGIVTSPIKKLGWHASDTALISFDDVFVPRENLLGEENQGFYLIMANFQWERLLLALGAVGAMQWCFDRTLAYAKERVAFGRSISGFQVIRHKFAEMALTIETARAMTYQALRAYLSDTEDATQDVTMAKLYTQRACVDIADECLQIHGGAGYMVEYGIERALRDARLGPIGGGTDEIMKEILGRSLGI